MTTVVISQPMFLPWIGIFAQMQLANHFIHYDDVQFPQGRSFTSRVQLRTQTGTQWLSAPVDRAQSGKLICETYFLAEEYWRERHLETIRHTYSKSKNFAEMYDLASDIYAFNSDNIATFNMNAINLIAERMGLTAQVSSSSTLGIGGRSTERLVEICRKFGAIRYVTGHGAINYLAHEQFEAVGIEVEYMAYSPVPWPQIADDFTPCVTILDLLAAVPFSQAADHLNPVTMDWRVMKALKEVSA